MVLDFTKGKYGLQLILLLFIVLISGLIFQLLGVAIINSVFNFDFSDLTSDNSSQLIMENENGYWIFFVLMALNSLGMFILSSLVFSKLISNNPNKYLLLNSKPPINFLILLPLFSMAGLILVSFMGELNMKLNLPEVFNLMEQNANELINYIISFRSSGNIIATIVLMAILPAVGEELFFRGILQKIFIQWTKKNWVGILITAFIFSAIHLQFLTFLPRFFMGIMLGYLFVWSKNLLIPIIAHLLHNLISILVAINSETPEMEGSEFSNLWLVVISFFVMIGISYRYYSISRKTHV
ncbi:CPBP family intramembrane metalloprotease [Flavobacteriales bacterium]|nr:CPBP family intramembrane metalloprotease [Flavobacteriales bacterium]